MGLYPPSAYVLYTSLSFVPSVSGRENVGFQDDQDATPSHDCPANDILADIFSADSALTTCSTYVFYVPSPTGIAS